MTVLNLAEKQILVYPKSPSLILMAGALVWINICYSLTSVIVQGPLKR